MKNKNIKFLKHTADVKFEVKGRTLGNCFENAALAMFKTIYHGKVKSKIKKKISVRGKDLESLMYNFLEELLFLFDAKDFILSKIKIKIREFNGEDIELKADLIGDNLKNYEIGLVIKAVTYNSMSIKKSKVGWKAVVVLDV
ncbi:MAG: archease [Nanoarchaeota archaeon]|mgnify:CR=1 FL=1